MIRLRGKYKNIGDNSQKTQGFSLITVLLVALLFSIVGTSNLKIGMINERMSANDTWRHESYLYSFGDSMFSSNPKNVDFKKIAPNIMAGNPYIQTTQHTSNTESIIATNYLERRNFVSGFSISETDGLLYEVKAVAIDTATGAKSDQTIGMILITPEN